MKRSISPHSRVFRPVSCGSKLGTGLRELFNSVPGYHSSNTYRALYSLSFRSKSWCIEIRLKVKWELSQAVDSRSEFLE
jgi:hypothetical protein